jgi:hypothetical protein
VDYAEGDELEVSPTIPIRTDHIRTWQLFNYVYGSGDDEFSMACLGTIIMSCVIFIINLLFRRFNDI